jgi:hypothetical protein
MSTDTETTVRSSWEGRQGPTTYHVTVTDHGETYEFDVVAVDIQYALASVLIEQKIFLTTADGIEIKPAE